MPDAAPDAVLVLQGGGALGAYQVGVYQALHEGGIEPDWVIGTSIGAINAALIAGNKPEHRMQRLHAFWDAVAARGADQLRLWPGLGRSSTTCTPCGAASRTSLRPIRASGGVHARSASRRRRTTPPRRCTPRWARWSTSIC